MIITMKTRKINNYSNKFCNSNKNKQNQTKIFTNKIKIILLKSNKIFNKI